MCYRYSKNPKMHTLLDLHGNIPAFLHVSDGKLHDVHALDRIDCYRYSKNPQIRHLKIPQVWVDRRHSDPWGCGCCDWRISWRYRSCITTA
jgi:hypothetical protein